MVFLMGDELTFCSIENCKFYAIQLSYNILQFAMACSQFANIPSVKTAKISF